MCVFNPRTCTACQTRGGPSFASGTLAKDVFLHCLRLAFRGRVVVCERRCQRSCAACRDDLPRRFLGLSRVHPLPGDGSAPHYRLSRLPGLHRTSVASRGATVLAPRQWALNIADSLPTGSRLGGAKERSRSSRRGRGWSNPSGCVVAGFHRWLQSQRSAAVLRARADAEAGRGQYDLLVMAGESGAARWSAGGSARSRSGSQYLGG